MRKHITIKNILFTPLVLVLTMLLGNTSAIAQQDSEYTQYMYNTETINPAYTGSREVFSSLALYRAQWVGLEGAPRTFSFTASSPLGERVGLGIEFTQDEIGPSIENTIAANFSYNIPMGEVTKLGFGLKGGLNILDVDFSKLELDNPNDPQFEFNIDNRVQPIIGVGLFLYQPKWYVGVSAPNLLTTKHYDDSTISEAKEEINAYLTAGYVFDLSDNLKFKPALLFKAVTGAPMAVDVSANFLFSERFTLGAAYRLDAAVSGLAGFQITNDLMVGYAYDYDTTNLGNYNNGSHEVFLRFDIGLGKPTRALNPRFY